MREYKKHVLVEADADEPETWCGERKTYDWYFQSSEHARAAVDKGTYMQPCDRCWRELNKEFHEQQNPSIVLGQD